MRAIFMHTFSSEFHTLQYIITKAERILLMAHSSPDADTVGAVLALKNYSLGMGKQVDVACFDPFPEFLKDVVEGIFIVPDRLELTSYDAVIACDSVERGFHKIVGKLNAGQVTVLIDHHPDINLKGDLSLIDASYSSVCELLYDFFIATKTPISKQMATCLALGILGDTGAFQHSNTTARVMEVASDLMRHGAPVARIIESVFSNKKLSTLKLWGRAFERAKINQRNGMIVTVVTHEDLVECGATSDDIAQVASILNTVPGTKFSLILSERGNGLVKGSLRSEEYKNTDVSEIAHQFGGGGHRLASGFEVQGRISETPEGWEIIPGV
ncbi:bifunctional oligoribonuclease/PAP phosphatase NrnA [Patescibacteria group bacterium]|nr:MAG: bifunctional oligoribonuclease/PAP phosphatase NrnA [Patescibacteria group bacterium]